MSNSTDRRRATIYAAGLGDVFGGLSAQSQRMTAWMGGAAMSPTRTILDNTARSREHSTLIALVHKAGRAALLSAASPLTLFAPTNAAFARLPQCVLEELMEPGAADQLAALLDGHLLAGTHTTLGLGKRVEQGGGSATLCSVAGAPLRLEAQQGRLAVAAGLEEPALVTFPNVMQSNGVVHAIDRVLLAA